MHELSIAQTIYEYAVEKMDEYPGCVVRRIGLQIGRLSDVVPEALQFGFDAIKQDTSLAATDLSIETIPAKGKCRSCHKEFVVEDFKFICPECESTQVDVLAGQELYISYLELDDQSEDGSKHSRNTLVTNGKD
jgi:hydrogenase nickel incorporation protein HypA/HybF